MAGVCTWNWDQSDQQVESDSEEEGSAGAEIHQQAFPHQRLKVQSQDLLFRQLLRSPPRLCLQQRSRQILLHEVSLKNYILKRI